MRAVLVLYVHRRLVGEDITSEFKRYRACGIILLFMNQALAGIAVCMVTKDKGFSYPGLMIYAMAMYAFYITIVAAVNVVKFRRRGSPLLSAAKVISLTAALVSMLSLETAMLAQFGGEDVVFRRLMLGISGGAVCTIVLTMAIYMIARSTRQLKRLQDVCRRVYANVPFYKKRFDEMGVKPEDIRSLDDLRRLPFTVKQDLRNNYPYGLFALPRANLARIQASSGTTGQAIVMGYTQRDLDNWAELVARCMCASGVTPTDIVHVAYGYGLFTGGLGAHDGAQKLGAMVVPASGGATRRQGQLLRDLGATVLACTPSFALHLWESAMEIGIDFRELPLKIGIFGGEPWSETMRHTMEEKMGIDAHNIYGLTEIMGPGVAIDCMEHNGIHLWEDHFIAEIIDPETGENLPEGEVGELVITTITKEGAPLIRYRTRDLTSIDTTPCRCGRTHLRLTRLAGRTDDMLIIRGVNVFPQQIESLLMEIPGLSPNYLIVVDRKGTLDTIEVQVEITQQLFNDRISDLQALEKRLQGNIKEYCGVTARIRLMEPHSLDRSGGKATRVIDNRPKMN